MSKYLKLNITFLLLALFSALAQSAYAADPEKAPNQKGEPDKNPIRQPILPLPRHKLMPEITYSKQMLVSGDTTYDFSKKRFSWIFILATWNQRSKEIVELLNQNIDTLNDRNVGVLVLFSQETKESIEEWRKENKPRFDNQFASRDFLDLAKNPKVPTFWVVGSVGEILQEYEMPTLKEVAISINKAMILTDF